MPHDFAKVPGNIPTFIGLSIQAVIYFSLAMFFHSRKKLART